MTKETVKKTGDIQNKVDQENLFESSDINTLLELVEAFGLGKRIPEEPTKENLMELLLAAKRHDVAIAKTVRLAGGAELECPPGHMIIRVTPKAAGMEWGQKSREVFFFAVQGDCIVGKRGVDLVVPDKYRSAWRDAVGYEYTLDGNPTVDSETGELRQPKMTKVERYAEDVAELYWNRDLEKEAADQKDLEDGAKRYQEERRARDALKQAVNSIGR